MATFLWHVKNCSVYIQCKGNIIVDDIKKAQITVQTLKLYYYTVSKVLLTLCSLTMMSEFLNFDLCYFIEQRSATGMYGTAA